MRSWRWLVPVLVVVAGCSSGAVSEVSWSDTTPLSGTVDSQGRVQVEGEGYHPLAAIDSPSIADGVTAFTVLMPIEYTDVDGEGFVEMWSVFADGSRFFTRTLAPSGGLGVLSGSGSRVATLPFDFTGSEPPVALEIAVVLPGTGTVQVGALSIEQGFASAAAPGSTWWGARAGGWIGAILGVTLGTLGVLVGRRAGRTGAAGTRRWAQGGVALGALLLLAGITALLADQPYVVFYPLLLGGAIGMLVFGGRLVAIRRQLRTDELRRMRAADLSR